MRRSSGAVVGDFSSSVSETIPPSSRPASSGVRLSPQLRYIMAISVQLLPTTSPVKRIGVAVGSMPMR